MPLRWLEQSEDDVPEGGQWLSPEESRVLAGLRFSRRRSDWLLGRWTAKCAVAASLDGPRGFSDIEIRAAPSGAPEVFCRGVPAPLAISISHRAGRACCAVADPPVELGCDLEVVEPRSRAFVEDYFTAEEQRLVNDAVPSDRPLLTTLLWSAKESALKALRIGLRADTRSVVVDLLATYDKCDIDGGRWRPLCVRGWRSVYHGWWSCPGRMIRTVLAPGYHAPPQEATNRCRSIPPA